MFRAFLYKINYKTVAKIGCFIIISAIVIQLIQHRIISFIFNILLCITFKIIFLFLKHKDPKQHNNFFKAFLLSIYLFSIIGLFMWPNSPTVFLIVIIATPLLGNITNINPQKFIGITILSIIGFILYRITIYLNHVNFIPLTGTINNNHKITTTVFDYSAILVLFLVTFVYVKKLLLDSNELRKLINPRTQYIHNKYKKNLMPNAQKRNISNDSIDELALLANFSLIHIKKNVRDKKLLRNINNLLNIKNPEQLRIFLLKNLKQLSNQLTKSLSPKTQLDITITEPFVKFVTKKQYLKFYKIINHIIIETIINSVKYSNHALITLDALTNYKVQIHVTAEPKINTKALLKNHSIYSTLKIIAEKINFMFNQSVVKLKIKYKNNYHLAIVFDLQKIKLDNKILSDKIL